MTYETLVYERRGAVAHITLNRPEVLNGLNGAMFSDLNAVFDAVAADTQVRAVLLTGAGRAFCSGADLSAPRDAPAGGMIGDGVAQNMHTVINPLIMRITTLGKPVVAAVNGVTAGGGVGLALACDIVIAAKSASFIQVFGPKLGIVPDMGCTWFLPRLVGRARATGLALLGDRLPAEKAAEWGLIWAAVEDGALMAEAGAIAERLAAGPTRGFGLIKKALNAAEDNDLADQLGVEAESQRIAFGTHDTIEGITAFLQKRAANFTGA
jgi:2-(1,2-epoxy-1,2-dihydrophenyl)acetyl-CoA isomerase